MVATNEMSAAPVGLAEAHRRLLADRSLQFDFFQTPPRRPPPHWLEELLLRLAPFLKYVFWALVVIFAAVIIGFLARELLSARFGFLRRKTKTAATDVHAWRPTQARARVLLAEADAMAAEGRFAEAAHHLLLHSIQDVEDHRPRTIRPALTSRDIAGLQAIPAKAREAFARIATVVERSLFGGRPVNAQDFADCRAAYETFVFAETPV